jgi:hypothetical protein
MPRHMLPQVGTLVWFFADPTRRPQAAIVTKRISKSSYNLSVFSPQAGTVTGVLTVAFFEAGQKPASGMYCTPTRIQDDYDGAGDVTSQTQRASSIAVTAGGTGYTVGDNLTIPNGVALRVTAAAGGIISAVSITNPGSVAKPGPGTAQSATGGTGTGATFTVTWVDN